MDLPRLFYILLPLTVRETAPPPAVTRRRDAPRARHLGRRFTAADLRLDGD